MMLRGCYYSWFSFLLKLRGAAIWHGTTAIWHGASLAWTRHGTRQVFVFVFICICLCSGLRTPDRDYIAFKMLTLATFIQKIEARRARVALLFQNFKIQNLRYNPYSDQLLFFEHLQIINLCVSSCLFYFVNI